MNEELKDFSSIGFMQGRLSPVIHGRIQKFPTTNWKTEIELASKYKFTKMEWTIDSETLNDNPLLTSNGQNSIIEICDYNNLSIPSITCDYFMENPPWKSDESHIIATMEKIFEGMIAIGARLIVIPLVDNSSIVSEDEEEILRNFFLKIADTIQFFNITVCFESDYEPKKLKKFIEEFPKKMFGINYDIGNSASLGFLPLEEILSYGNRILNVHVKDRKYKGATVPLSEGDADFEAIFKLLHKSDYRGNYILQTARAQNNDHLGALLKFRDMTQAWINKNE